MLPFCSNQHMSHTSPSRHGTLNYEALRVCLVGGDNGWRKTIMGYWVPAPHHMSSRTNIYVEWRSREAEQAAFKARAVRRTEFVAKQTSRPIASHGTRPLLVRLRARGFLQVTAASLRRAAGVAGKPTRASVRELSGRLRGWIYRQIGDRLVSPKDPAVHWSRLSGGDRIDIELAEAAIELPPLTPVALSCSLLPRIRTSCTRSLPSSPTSPGRAGAIYAEEEQVVLVVRAHGDGGAAH